MIQEMRLPLVTPGQAIFSPSSSYSAMFRQFRGRLHHLMPAGRPLTDAAWDSRHRGMVILLWLHVIGITCAEVFLGHTLINSVAETGIIAGVTLLAS
jgi:hypothetical protein